MRIDTALSPITGVYGVQPGARRPGEATPFLGPSVVRGAAVSPGAGTGVYGPDARMRNNALAPGEEEAAETRTINSLEQRDREVRQNEEAKGEAVGGSNFIYQTGPDGKRYAVGTGAHAVRPDEGGASGATQQAADGSEMSENDQALLAKLEARDAKVRAHEAAHVMAAGGQAGSPTYTYQTGPDGQRYAIGGSVSISTLSTGDPENDARQAKTAQRAAMATGEPSSADMQTAAKANSLMARAQKEAAGRYAEESQQALEYFPGLGKIA